MSNTAIKIHIMHCGTGVVDKALAYKEKSWNPFAFTGMGRSKKHRIHIPLTCYLIEHPKGLLLIDTGWSPLVRTSVVKALGFMQSMLSTTLLADGKAAVEQLASKGFQAADIGYVVLTHLHGDHISGLQSVSAAKNIIVSDIEFKAANSNPIVYRKAMWKGTQLKTFTFDSTNIGPENKSFDLFGDQSIQLVFTPGHCAGLTSVLIQNNDAFVILCADVAYSEKSWKEMILPGLTTDKNAARRSLQWLQKMSELPNCKGIFASHDNSIQEQTIVL